MPLHLADSAQQQGPTSRNFRRPRVKVVGGRAFVYDAASAATLLAEHRIWAAPVGVRRARNKSPEHNLPSVLSQEQAALVLGRNLADVVACGSSDDEGHGDYGRVEEREAHDEQTTKDIDSSRWRFPETSAERKSMAVFEDLWVKGLCAVSGSNYGADFVVYDGPPTERHSVAAVIMGRGANDELSPAEVSGFARVQQAVGKRSVIATAPPATEDSTPTPTWTGGAAAAAVLAAPRDVEAGPTDVVGRVTAPLRQQGGQVTTAASPTNEGVRYVTLQFHSVSYRT